MPNCLACGAEVDEYDSGYYSRSMQCIPCYVRKTSESMVSVQQVRDARADRGGSPQGGRSPLLLLRLRD